MTINNSYIKCEINFQNISPINDRESYLLIKKYIKKN